MASPSFGLWPPGSDAATSLLAAFAVVEAPSEPFPNGRYLVNSGTILGTLVHGGTGDFTITLASGYTASNTGVQVTPWGSSADGLTVDAAYNIVGDALQITTRDAAGALTDPNRFTVAVYRVPA